jgi:hypothetical protein
MTDVLKVKLRCPCGLENRWSVFVASDVRRCCGCGRTYRLSWDADVNSLDVELLESVDPRGLEGLDGDVALMVEAERWSGEGASILLCEEPLPGFGGEARGGGKTAELCDGGTGR